MMSCLTGLFAESIIQQIRADRIIYSFALCLHAPVCSECPDFHFKNVLLQVIKNRIVKKGLKLLTAATFCR